MFLLNSRLTHFTATILRWHPFFRSYGARLPSSLTRFHSRALVYSTHPPVSVYGTGDRGNTMMLFLANCPVMRFGRSLGSQFNQVITFLFASHHGLTAAGAGILNLLSIAYALRPQLRSRLTLGGRTFPRKPWVYGGRELNPSYRYSCLHSHLSALHGWLPSRFDALTTLPYQSTGTNPDVFQSFGIPLIANHFRREITR